MGGRYPPKEPPAPRRWTISYDPKLMPYAIGEEIEISGNDPTYCGRWRVVDVLPASGSYTLERIL